MGRRWWGTGWDQFPEWTSVSRCLSHQNPQTSLLQTRSDRRQATHVQELAFATLNCQTCSRSQRWGSKRRGSAAGKDSELPPKPSKQGTHRVHQYRPKASHKWKGLQNQNLYSLVRLVAFSLYVLIYGNIVVSIQVLGGGSVKIPLTVQVNKDVECTHYLVNSF